MIPTSNGKGPRAVRLGKETRQASRWPGPLKPPYKGAAWSKGVLNRKKKDKDDRFMKLPLLFDSPAYRHKTYRPAGQSSLYQSNKWVSIGKWRSVNTYKYVHTYIFMHICGGHVACARGNKPLSLELGHDQLHGLNLNSYLPYHVPSYKDPQGKVTLFKWADRIGAPHIVEKTWEERARSLKS